MSCNISCGCPGLVWQLDSAVRYLLHTRWGMQLLYARACVAVLHAGANANDVLLSAVLQIAGGNGEQVVSRDIQRLARRLNFSRLMSWYHTGNGFFINTGLLMFSLLVNAWYVIQQAYSNRGAAQCAGQHACLLWMNHCTRHEQRCAVSGKCHGTNALP